MKEKLLIVDAIINFILGVLLLLSIAIADQLTNFLGVPEIDQAFYPSIMGSIFIGIGISLVLESKRVNEDHRVGLGLAGAITINLCGGIVLMGWLVFGNLDLPIRGSIFLWSISLMLVIISSIEIIAQRKK
jgi:hypothetical protein